ncbi:MAG TPA: sigma-54 dependent transcriptional regulator [Bryobacteraceae bacterium]|nr:sigma-54 dependent transcriptional regulator [Bryobacteraceae bacterium]
MNTVLWIDESATGTQHVFVKDGPEKLQVLFAANLPDAFHSLKANPIEAVLVHLPIAGYSGPEVLRQIHEQGCKVPIVIYEPTGAVSRAHDLTQRGAFQYVGHPVKPEELCELLAVAIRHHGVKSNAVSPQQTRSWRDLLVGSSSGMREVIEIVELVGNRRSTVLITGETGTGKEVAARALHMASNRSASRMVAVNCAALPDHLLEAELFGHTKGAFTGAVNARVGLFEQAHRGTIFLDEIGEMPLPLQAKLLRVLQEREIQRIGSSEPIPIDVRVIAASNVNLLEAVANRRFREDLYYRLNVVALRMPALREHPSDIPELAAHFLDKVAEHEPAWKKHISAQAMEMFLKYSWPGNVRQLEHALESAAALSGARSILYPGDFDLPAEIRPSEFGSLSSLDVPESGINFEELMTGIERRLLERALAKSGGNKARAASMLHMKRTTLLSKFKSLEVCA